MGAESVSPDGGHSFKCPLVAGASVSLEDTSVLQIYKTQK